MGAIVVPPLEVVTQVGNAANRVINVVGVYSSGRGMLGVKNTDGNYTVINGQTLIHPYLNIPSPRTWNVNVNGALVSVTSLTVAVGGTLNVAVGGEVRVL